ncbi:MAG: hypothetical protein AAF456_04280 [Planctomycetota bacterium]
MRTTIFATLLITCCFLLPISVQETVDSGQQSTGLFQDNASIISTVPVVFAPQNPPIDPFKELWIKDLSVVEDPVRTVYDENSIDPSQGAWTFGRMMEHMAGGHDPGLFTEALFRGFEVQQTINGFDSPVRPGFVETVIDPWRARSERAGLPGLAPQFAPMRLSGIVNRIDLRSPGGDGDPVHAGEGRLVYHITDENGGPTQGSIILEYELLADDCEDIKLWANRWHRLGSIPFGPDFNRYLERLVNNFAGPDVAPNRPNGSAIVTIRTNDSVHVDEPWEWREWRMNATGFLEQVTVAMSPQSSLNGSTQLARYINENEQAIIAQEHVVPLVYRGVPFRGAVSGDDILHSAFNAPLIQNPLARHRFSLNTCVGCHRGETPTGFFHAFPRGEGSETNLSFFLTGGTHPDPFTGEVRSFNDLKRRSKDLQMVLNSACPEIEAYPRIYRVH